MSHDTYQFLLYAMSVAGAVVFVALYFVRAGYGMFRTSSWGISLPNKLAWMLMEAPAFVIMLWGWLSSDIDVFCSSVCLCLPVFVALFSAFVCFPAADERQKSYAGCHCSYGDCL